MNDILKQLSEAETKEKAAELMRNFRDENDTMQSKLKKHSLLTMIVMIALAVLIVVLLLIKYIIYIAPEKVGYEKNVKDLSSVEINTETLNVMPFNSDLTAANEQVLIASTKDNTVKMDFLLPETTKVIARAEIYVDESCLDKKPLKKWWTKLLHPNDDSLIRIGATGWVRPGEIVTDLKLDELPNKQCNVTVKFTAVNPANENISAGEFSMNTIMFVVDYNGKMLDENGSWVNAN